MSHFAKINKDNIVTEVIVAEQEFIDSGIVGDPASWIQTSYNTWHGKHPNNTPLRKNFASVGFTYDKKLDAFIPPQPYPSWKFNKTICDWEPPIPCPITPIPHYWDEDELQWKSVSNN